MFKREIIFSILTGLITGLGLVVFLFVKRNFQLPEFLPITVDLLLSIFVISYIIRRYRKRNANHSDKIALQLGHITFLSIITPLLILRLVNGWFGTKKPIVIVLGLIVIVLLGRLLTHLIILTMKRENKI